MAERGTTKLIECSLLSYSKQSLFHKALRSQFFTHRTLPPLNYHIEAEQMEILAIVVLGLSAVVSFSTSERKSKPLTNRRHNNTDPDWAFTEAFDSDTTMVKQEEA